MKKGLLITLAAFYLLATVGIHLHIHYCCGKVADVSIFGEHDACCKGHDEATSCNVHNKCCSFSEIDFKVDEAHVVPSFAFTDVPAVVSATPHIVVSFTQQDWTKQPTLLPRSQAPPDDTPAFIRFRSLILYA